MTTSAGIGRFPYELTVHLMACPCDGPVKSLGKSRKLSRLVKDAEGFWNVYLAFFGDLVQIVSFVIVDVRDGQIMWRNGRLTDGGCNVTEQDRNESPAGQAFAA